MNDTCVRAATAATAPTAAEPHMPAGAYDPPAPSALDVEADVQDVAVLDDVRLALEALLARARRLRVRARLDEVVPARSPRSG